MPTCVVKNCTSRSNLHRFPPQLMRFSQWVFLIGRTDILYNIRNTFRICDLHFTEKMKVPMFRSNLRLDAFPILHLPHESLAGPSNRDFNVPIVPSENPHNMTNPDEGPIDSSSEINMEFARRANKTKCCVPRCDDKISKRHRFPIKDTPLLQRWLEAVAVPHLKELPPEQIYQSFYVCDSHFSNEYKVPGTKRGLRKDAFPTIDLSEHPEDTKTKAVPPTNELLKIPELKGEAPEPEPPIVSEINEPVIEETTVRSVQILTEDGPCELCRICLKPAKDSLVNQKIIEKKLTTILPAFNFDLYPNPKVCIDCVTILNQAVAFHDKILESDTFIGKYLSTTLPNAGPLDIIIVPPDLKEEDAVKILKKCDDSPSEEVSTNASAAPAIISEPIKRSPDREHCYARPPKLRKYNRSIETVDSILDSEGVSLTQLGRKVRKWKQLDRWGKPPYLCEKCGQVYNTLSSYRSHLQAHRLQLAKYVCDICGLTLTNVNPYHHSLKHKTKNHKCKLCWKAFFSSAGLKNHEERDHPGGVITMVQCEICGTHVKNFNLKFHCRKYHPKEPQTYECKVCYKTFSHKHYLKRHFIVHSEDKYQCEYCNRIMKRPDSLKKHIELYHLNQQGKHYCHICSKPFWNKKKLDSHTEIFHSNTNIVYECHICGHTFRFKKLLKKHISTQHQQQFLCGLCEKHLPNIVQLRKHYKKEHPQYDFIEEVS